MLEHLVSRVADALRVTLYASLFFSLVATCLVMKLRGAKTLKRATVLGVAAGSLCGAVLGILALIF